MSYAATIPDLPAHYRLWPDPARALLGKGGASEVFRAKDERFGVLVALKVLRADGGRVLARLEREAALTAQVNHPNVVALHDFGATMRGDTFVAFALASDGSLLDCAATPPPWAELRGFLLDLLRALGALHARGILHLDVKLSNLLLHRTAPRTRALWLADLGVAQTLDLEDASDGPVVGTVVYMAPERLTGQRHRWGPSTDLFSVGAVTWRLLTGALPFEDRGPLAALAARQRPPNSVPFLPWYEAPSGLDQVLLPLLDPDPLARYDLADDLIRAIEALPPSLDELVGRPLPRIRPNPQGRPTQVPDGCAVWHRPAPRDLPTNLVATGAPRRPPQSPTLLQWRDLPLVGRESVMGNLWKAAQVAVRRARPVLLHLVGPRGAGRTRVAQEFTRLLEVEGLGEGVGIDFAVRDGPAQGLQGAWRRLTPIASDPEQHVAHISALFARDRNAPVEAVQRDAELLHSWMLPRAGGAPPDRSAARRLLAQHLARRSWRGLAWVVVDDAHLADEGDDVWSAIDEIMLQPHPIVVLVTSREDVAVPPLAARLARHAKVSRTLRLPPLGNAHLAELARACLPVSPRVVRAVASHAGGIPLHVRDLIVHMFAEGNLVAVEGGSGEGLVYDFVGDVPAIPSDRRALANELIERVRRTQPELTEVLSIATLAGRGTPVTVINRVAPEGLTRLVVAGLARTERDSFLLVPPELPEAVRDQVMAPDQLQRLHQRLADAWRAEGVDDPNVAARVGLHLLDAGNPTDAVGHLDDALEMLQHVRPLHEVVRLAGRTMDAHTQAGAPAGPGWVRAAFSLSNALWYQGRPDEAMGIDDALAQMDLELEPAVRAACLRASHLCMRDRASEALAALNLVDVQSGALPPLLRAQYLAERAHAHAWRLENDAAMADADAGLALALGSRLEGPIRVLRSRLLAVAEPEAALAEAGRAIETARRDGLARPEAEAWSQVVRLLVATSRVDLAVVRLREAIARMRSYGDRVTLAKLLNSLGEVHRLAGDEDEARAAYLESIRVAGEDQTGAGGIARTNLALLALVDARWTELRGLRPTDTPPADDAVLACAWAWLDAILAAAEGGARPQLERSAAFLMSQGEVERAVQLGADGVLMVRALSHLLARRDSTMAAARLEMALRDAAEVAGADLSAGDALLRRFRQATETF